MVEFPKTRQYSTFIIFPRYVDGILSTWWYNVVMYLFVVNKVGVANDCTNISIGVDGIYVNFRF